VEYGTRENARQRDLHWALERQLLGRPGQAKRVRRHHLEHDDSQKRRGTQHRDHDRRNH
jgi:hypothetical protein